MGVFVIMVHADVKTGTVPSVSPVIYIYSTYSEVKDYVVGVCYCTGDLDHSAKCIRLWAALVRTASPPRVPASPLGGPEGGPWCSADGRRRRPRCRCRIDASGHDAVHCGHTVGEHVAGSSSYSATHVLRTNPTHHS